MSLRHKEVNPLAVANMRRMDFLPPHFEPIYFDLVVGEKEISDWIHEHTQGRFFLGQWFNPKGEKVVMCECAAFEIHSETSYFAMMLNQINKINWA
jgi:hypothetical protein